MREAAAGDLVPRGFAGRSCRVFETGGTTGRPCRVVDVTTGQYNVTIYATMLEARGLASGDGVAMTPSGPHAYGTFVARLVDRWGGRASFIDFDPRWVKRLIRRGEPARPYFEHLIQQALRLLETQRPSLLFTTSKLLVEMSLALPKPLSEYGVRAVCTGGTSSSLEEIRYLREHHLDGVEWIDTYGNTLMGHALQADAEDGGPHRAYYLPPPLGFIRVVDAKDWRRQVGLGERGQVLLITLLEDLFIPNLLERDSAIRTGPHEWSPWEGVSAIVPLWADASEETTEGVY